MKVGELISALASLPLDADVCCAGSSTSWGTPIVGTTYEESLVHRRYPDWRIATRVLKQAGVDYRYTSNPTEPAVILICDVGRKD